LSVVRCPLLVVRCSLFVVGPWGKQGDKHKPQFTHFINVLTHRAQKKTK